MESEIVIGPSKKLLYFPEVTLSLNSIGHQENSRQPILFIVSNKTLKPIFQDIVEVFILKLDIRYIIAIAIIEPSSLFKKEQPMRYFFKQQT